MLDRLTYGAAAVIALFGLALLDAYISDQPELFAAWLPSESAAATVAGLLRKGSLIPLAFGALAFGAAVELSRLARAAGLRPQVRWAAFWSPALMLAPWLVSGILTPWWPTDLSGSQWQLSAVVLGLAGTVFGMLVREDLRGGLSDVAATWAIIIYAGLLPSFATQLRCHDFLHGADGAWLVLILLMVVKASDIGAFFVGSAVGRTRLIPRVSPNKTVEGAIGGVACGVAVSLLFWGVFSWTEPSPVDPVGAGDPMGGAAPGPLAADSSLARARVLMHGVTELFHALTFAQAIVFGALISVCGQLGDLLESVFKRSAGAKDSADLLPGFGGVLDIIDSPVFAAPVAWFLLTCWWPVV